MTGGKSYVAAGFAALFASVAVLSTGSASPIGQDDLSFRIAMLEKTDRQATAQDDLKLPNTVAERFTDAPDGVDPVVTGPVSTAFKQRREAAGCDTAVWPNVPAACYPD